MKKLLLLFLLFSTIAGKVFSQVVGDYISASSGVWSTAATWQTWNGTAWVVASTAPGATNNVKIQNGHTITVDASGKPCADLVVDAGAKLFCNGFVNVYVNVYGDTLMSNGTIGNGATFDGISFNIYGTNCRILGTTGTFDASRIRKNDATNTTTNLIIERDVKLRFCGGRQTQIYNNANSTGGSTGTRFNVTVAAGATLMLDSTVSAECQAIGSSTTVNLTCGTISGNVNVTTLATAGLSVGMMVSGAGIIPGTTVAAVVSGTQFTLSQNAVVTNAANSLTFGGNQITNTAAIVSYFGATFGVPGSLTNCRVYGTGIAPGAYIVGNPTLVSGAGATGIYNMQLSLPNTGPVSGTIYFLSDGNAAVDGITGTAPGASAGSFTINGTMLVSGFLYLTTNNGSTVADSSVTWTVNNGGLLKVGNVLTSVSGTAKHTFRVAAGGKFEVFGLPGFSTALVATNNIYDIQAGSFTEFSGKGNQNVPVILSVAPSSGYYGNLKISGYGTKSEIATTAYNVFNNFEITNLTGAPKFNGSVSTQFFVGGNWINYHDSAFIEPDFVTFNRTGVSTITCPSGEVFSTLRYSKTDSSAVRFLSNIKVKTQLSWSNNGHFHLNGNTLSLFNPIGSAISINTTTAVTARYILGETGDFNSKVRWNIGTTNAYTRYAIPFAKGSGSANYTPFAFTVGSNVQVDTMTVSTYSTPATNLPWPTAAPYGVTNLNSSTNLSPDNRDATADRFWYVGFTSPNVTNDSIVLTYASPSELPAAPFNNPDSIRGQYWDAANGSWALPVVGYNVLNAVVIPNPSLNRVWSLVSNISPMGPLPLPIELVDFRGKYSNNQSVLSWVTASEKDNDYFILERSENAHDFTQIGKIDGAGNSNSFLNYQFIDVKPINQVAYYRLKQVDFDGQFSNSNVIALRNMKSFGNQFLHIYPQPASTDVFIEQGLFVNGETFSVEIFNNLGALVQKELYTSDESGKLAIHFSNLEQGMYMLRISDGAHQLTKPLIIQ
ncbi:MAG: hypothetical protein RL516_1545 [Bacteroidota bacterium]|jgi:hypothetical protein